MNVRLILPAIALAAVACNFGLYTFYMHETRPVVRGPLYSSEPDDSTWYGVYVTGGIRIVRADRNNQGNSIAESLTIDGPLAALVASNATPAGHIRSVHENGWLYDWDANMDFVDDEWLPHTLQLSNFVRICDADMADDGRLVVSVQLTSSSARIYLVDGSNLYSTQFTPSPVSSLTTCPRVSFDDFEDEVVALFGRKVLRYNDQLNGIATLSLSASTPWRDIDAIGGKAVVAGGNPGDSNTGISTLDLQAGSLPIDHIGMSYPYAVHVEHQTGPGNSYVPGTALTFGYFDAVRYQLVP